MSKKYLERMHQIARDKGGKCLSRDYVNSGTNLKWQCREGHTWEATPFSIESGSWCSICAIQRNSNELRLTIEDMKRLARERNCVCLSDEYVNMNRKLKWLCEEGHTWEATPSSIISKEICCPECDKDKN